MVPVRERYIFQYTSLVLIGSCLLIVLFGCAASKPCSDWRDACAWPAPQTQQRVTMQDIQLHEMLMRDLASTPPIEFAPRQSPFYGGINATPQMPAFTCRSYRYGGQTTTNCTPY